VVIALFCAVFLAVQIGLPVVQLLDDVRPARWGWQMYAGYGANAVEYRLVRPDGTVEPVRLTQYAVVFRGDMPMERYAPQHLCRVTEARAVELSIAEGPWERVPCS
jgi:hypothetical protein